MKRYIIGFILGGIIFSCISVYATIYYEASQINYKSTTLDHAIDELYTTQNTTISNKDSQITTLQNTLNTPTHIRITTRSTSTEIMFDILRQNGFQQFKVVNSSKASGASCDISKTMSSTTWQYVDNNYVFNTVYDIPNNNDRLRFNSTNGYCDFAIYLYR